MTRKVSIAEQLEELESEWERRNREYPTLVAQGRMRAHRMELKIERLEACIKLLEWLDEHQDALREYVLYATRIVAPAQGGEWNDRVKDGPESATADGSNIPAGFAEETPPSASASV